MFETFPNLRIKAAAVTAGTVVAAMLSARGGAADPKSIEVKLQSRLPVAVEVKFSGDKALEKVSPWQAAANSEAHSIGKFPPGTTIKWEAKPTNDQYKNRTTSCSGQKTVTGLTTTITISEDDCSKAAASAVPKPATAPAPKADDTGKKTDDTSKKDAPKTDASNKTDIANNKTDSKASGRGAGSDHGGIKVTFENTLGGDAVSLLIWDRSESAVYTDPMAAKINGKNDGKNAETIAFTKDRYGKYFIEVVWRCSNHEGRGKFKDSAYKIQIVRSSDGGCELRGAAER